MLEPLDTHQDQSSGDPIQIPETVDGIVTSTPPIYSQEPDLESNQIPSRRPQLNNNNSEININIINIIDDDQLPPLPTGRKSSFRIRVPSPQEEDNKDKGRIIKSNTVDESPESDDEYISKVMESETDDESFVMSGQDDSADELLKHEKGGRKRKREKEDYADSISSSCSVYISNKRGMLSPSPDPTSTLDMNQEQNGGGGGEEEEEGLMQPSSSYPTRKRFIPNVLIKIFIFVVTTHVFLFLLVVIVPFFVYPGQKCLVQFHDDNGTISDINSLYLTPNTDFSDSFRQQQHSSPFFNTNGPKLNDIQLLGTHNSYHLQPNRFFRLFSREWHYSHSHLDTQLSVHGIRSLELDIHVTPDTVQVYHVQLFDDQTTCFCFLECLHKIRSFMFSTNSADRGNGTTYNSEEPIFVYLEPKRKFFEDRFCGLRLRGYEYDSDGLITSQHYHQLQDMILSVFNQSQLITPKDIRYFPNGTFEWPDLNSARGKIAFILYDRVLHSQGFADDEGGVASNHTHILFSSLVDKDATRMKPPTLLPFLTSLVSNKDEDDDKIEYQIRTHDSTIPPFIILDNPYRYFGRVRDWVKAGFFVRVRSDAGAIWNVDRAKQALNSGAQVVATDFVQEMKNVWREVYGG